MTNESLDTEKTPATVREAVEYLRRTMAQQALAELAALAQDQLIQTHHGLGAGIRNGHLNCELIYLIYDKNQ